MTAADKVETDQVKTDKPKVSAKGDNKAPDKVADSGQTVSAKG
jgi:hypothetical protein